MSTMTLEHITAVADESVESQLADAIATLKQQEADKA